MLLQYGQLLLRYLQHLVVKLIHILKSEQIRGGMRRTSAGKTAIIGGMNDSSVGKITIGVGMDKAGGMDDIGGTDTTGGMQKLNSGMAISGGV